MSIQPSHVVAFVIGPFGANLHPGKTVELCQGTSIVIAIRKLAPEVVNAISTAVTGTLASRFEEVFAFQIAHLSSVKRDTFFATEDIATLIARLKVF